MESTEVLRKRGRPSKLDAFRSEIGLKSDEEIAHLAGCTVANVYMYRRRHNIALTVDGAGVADAATENTDSTNGVDGEGAEATDVGQGADAADAVVEEGTTTTRQARAERRYRSIPPLGDRRRGSVLDRYRHLLGKLSDAEVARLAGCTAANVSIYRRKNGIPAARDEGNHTAEGAGAVAVDPIQALESAAQSSVSGKFLYMVEFDGANGLQQRAIIAQNLADAMLRASRIEQDGQRVHALRLVGEML